MAAPPAPRNGAAATVGIDRGGTNVRAAAVGADGRLSGFLLRPFDRTLDGEACARALAGLAREIAGGAPAALGVAIPATVRPPDGEILERSSNIKGLEGFPLVRRLRELAGAPAGIGNDADLAMLGEAGYGAARGARHAVTLTLGTGIGSGLWLDGKLWPGSRGHGAEIGLSRTRGPGGGWVAVEELASAEAVRRASGRSTEEAFGLAKAGDATALAAVDGVCEQLGAVLANLHMTLDLEVAVLSGGMAKAGDWLLQRVRSRFDAICPDPYRRGLEIKLGALGDHAGILGAAALAREVAAT